MAREAGRSPTRQIDRRSFNPQIGTTSVRRCRVNKCKRDPTVFPIDREIGIQCQDSMPTVNLGHAYDARIG